MPISNHMFNSNENQTGKILGVSQFASLTAIEPALGKKLTHPLIELISRFQTNYFSPYKLIYFVPVSSPFPPNSQSNDSFPLQFGALTPLEPRLGKKLIEPLTNLIHRQVVPSFSSFFFIQ